VDAVEHAEGQHDPVQHMARPGCGVLSAGGRKPIIIIVTHDAIPLFKAAVAAMLEMALFLLGRQQKAGREI
jgi:hypothetical protein